MKIEILIGAFLLVFSFSAASVLSGGGDPCGCSQYGHVICQYYAVGDYCIDDCCWWAYELTTTTTTTTVPTTTTTSSSACSTHAQCSRACTSACPSNVYGCCYGCYLGQCVSGSCQCRYISSYCSGSPSYQVGSACGATTTTTTVPTTTTTTPSSCISGIPSCSSNDICQWYTQSLYAYCDPTEECCKFPNAYSVTFYQSGIPSGTTWGVWVYDPVAGNTRYTSSGSSVTVSNVVESSSYSYDSLVGANYECSSGCSGTITSSGSKTATYTYDPSAYSVTFQQSGVPSPLSWYVTVDGIDHVSSSSSLTVGGLTGTVSYNYKDTAHDPPYICQAGCSGTVSSATTKTAYYEQEATTVQWGISVNQGEGTFCVVGQSGSYSECTTSSKTIQVPKDSYVRLEATPYGGYSFQKFSGSSLDEVYTNPTDWFQATASGALYAYFYPPTVIWTITIADGEGETCVAFTAGGNNYNYCTTSSRVIRIPWNTPVTMTATPDDGYDFHYFSGSGGESWTNPLDLTADGTGTIYTYFAPESTPPPEEAVTYVVEIATGGGGYSTITYSSHPDGGSTTQYAYENNPVIATAVAGSTVTLRAFPDSDHNFDRWVGLPSGTSYDTPKTFTAEESASVVANFVPAEVDLTITVTQGKGTVCVYWPWPSYTNSPCTTSSMDVTIPWNTNIRIDSTPRSDEYFTWEFYRYGGTESYYSDPADISATYSGTIYAQFNPVTIDWTIITSPSGAGSVCAGGYCTTTERTVSLLYNNPTTLQATANSGYIFTGFSGNIVSTSENPKTVQVLNPGNIYANFIEDCSSYDCSAQGYPGRVAYYDPVDGACKCDPCDINSDCIEGWCCEAAADISGGRECREGGYVYNNMYLCDPPQGFVKIKPDLSSTLVDWLIYLLS